jgi:restriction endonuclease Mrr
MPIPRVQPLLLPVLRMIGDGAQRTSEALREGVKRDPQFDISDEDARQTHPKSGQNVLVNRVAWALAYLVMGEAITLTSADAYQVTQRGIDLKGNPQELTIAALRRFYDEATQAQKDQVEKPAQPAV